MLEHAAQGARIVRLKSGDPAIFGRLDEEIDALENAGVSWQIVPGITSASAAAAAIGTSLTRRGRNSSLQFLTGRDVDGFAEHDWKKLAEEGSTAAIYMGLKASQFLAGRLLMFGAKSETPVTIVENASRIDQRVIATRLGEFVEKVRSEDFSGPAIIFLGLSPRTISKANLEDASTEAETTKAMG